MNNKRRRRRKEKYNGEKRDMPTITPKSRRNEEKNDSLIFLNQNIYVMNVNFSSLEYLWSSISAAGAIVVAYCKRRDNKTHTHTHTTMYVYIKTTSILILILTSITRISFKTMS